MWSKGKELRRRADIKTISGKLKELKEEEVPEHITEIKMVSGELDKLLEQENIWWKQSAKVHWLQQGDRNTRFSHAYASQRKRKNLIFEVTNSQGCILRKQPKVEGAFGEYFSEVYT